MNLLRSAGLAFALLAVPMAGCAQLSSLTNGGSSDIRLPVGKGLLVAELATTGANVTAKTAAETNACHGSCAISVKAKLDTLNKAVSLAYKAWIAGNSALATSIVSDALTQAVDVSQQAKSGAE